MDRNIESKRFNQRSIDNRRNHQSHKNNIKNSDNSNDLRRAKRKQIKRSKRIGYIITFLELLCSIVFTGLLIYINILPAIFLVGIIAFEVIFCFLSFLSQSSRKLRTPGKVFSIIICLTLSLGSYYLAVTSGALSRITGGNVQKENISVIVLKTDSAKSLSDVRDYNFGISKTIDRSNTDKALNKIKQLTGKSVKYTEQADYSYLVKSLFKEKTKVIIFNEAQRSSIKELYPDFDKDTRIITTFTFENKLSSANAVAVTKEPFIVYLSGNDQTGDIAATGRTDVNICAVVNPKTKQVLMVTTPRDAYLPVYDPAGEVPTGSMDKLTHTGNFGIDCTMKTLGHLYDTTINYYVVLNFTGFSKIVDAIGGLKIDCEATFTAIDGGQYTKGIMDMDGITALNYARERHAFPDGDFARNRHQTQVLKAIIDKMMSPKILTSYASLMDKVPGAFRTSFESNDISGLVKMQLADGAQWNIVSYNVIGSGGYDYTYSMPSRQIDIVNLYDSYVDNAKALIKDVLSGKEVKQEDIDKLDKSN